DTPGRCPATAASRAGPSDQWFTAAVDPCRLSIVEFFSGSALACDSDRSFFAHNASLDGYDAGDWISGLYLVRRQARMVGRSVGGFEHWNHQLSFYLCALRLWATADCRGRNLGSHADPGLDHINRGRYSRGPKCDFSQRRVDFRRTACD